MTEPATIASKLDVAHVHASAGRTPSACTWRCRTRSRRSAWSGRCRCPPRIPGPGKLVTTESVSATTGLKSAASAGIGAAPHGPPAPAVDVVVVRHWRWVLLLLPHAATPTARAATTPMAANLRTGGPPGCEEHHDVRSDPRRPAHTDADADRVGNIPAMLDQHDTIHAVAADFDTIFSWDYERSRGCAREALREGQDLAVERHRPTSTGRSTSTPRRSAGSSAAAAPMRFQALQDAEDSPVKHFGEKEWRQVSVEIQNSLLSQFMHGEQGALLCTARIVETVPWIDAKYYAATQVMDEARHVEVFAPLPRREARQPVRHQRQPQGASSTTSSRDPRWDIAYLGMQIMVEGLALAAFGMLHQLTTEPLLKKLLRYVMSDEARHVAFGVLSLQEFYKELSDAEMRERQEFAFDVAKRLQRRFAHTEMWATMGVDPDAVYRTMDRVNPPAQQMFQQLLFSKIVPNCKKLGLIDASGGWLRERFTEIGVIEFEDLADTGEEYAELDEVARDRETAA